MTVLGWSLAAVGVVAVLASLLVNRAAKPRLDLIIRVGGLSVPQVQGIRRALQSGRLPDDGAVRPAAIAYARQMAHNIPLQIPGQALMLAGFGTALGGLAVLTGVRDGAIWPWMLVAAVLLGLAVFLVTAMRALRGARKVLRGVDG